MLAVALILGIILGWMTFPLVIFLRARRDDAWDDSNILNIYRVVAHLATHPDDFGDMRYSNGNRPFWYISEDEITEVVKTRKNQDG